MSRPVAVAVVAILLLSGLVTALTSAVVSPRNAPDERHHYSYVQHVARHPLQFPPRYEQIRTDKGDPNHLVHPPLYYQLMAIPYALLDVERQLTGPGRELDRHGRVSSAAAIPPLRAASLLLAALHLFGVYLLLRDLVAAGTLPGWGAVLAAACLTLVPGFTFIAGTLNNDVLALAVWPFLVLATVRFLRQGRRTDAYLAAALTAAAVLTKATLWLLALACAVAVAARAVATIDRRGGGALRRVRRAVRRLAPASGGQWALLALSLAAVAAAVAVLAANLVRYGSLQPAYHVVFGLSLEESKFFSVPEGGVPEKGARELAGWITSLTLRSLFGILSHDERLYSSHPERLAQAVIGITAVAVLLAAWRLARRPSRADWLAAGMLGVSLLFVAVLLVTAAGSYQRYGHFGAHGRYLIGYLGLWILGLVIALERTRESARSAAARVAAAVLAIAVAVLLVALFVRPTYYLSRTTELHARAAVAERIAAEAAHRGLRPVVLEPVAPERFVAHGAGHTGGLLPSPRFLIAWRGSTVAGELATGGQGCVEVWVYGFGERAWGEDAELALRLLPVGAAGAEAADGLDPRQAAAAEEVVELPPRPEVARAVLPAPDAPRAVLTVEARNVRAPAPHPLAERWWPRTRVSQVFAAYAGPARCR